MLLVYVIWTFVLVLAISFALYMYKLHLVNKILKYYERYDCTLKYDSTFDVFDSADEVIPFDVAKLIMDQDALR